MLFGKKRRDPAQAIADFWQWWPTVRDRVGRSIDDGWADELIEEINLQVAAIHPDLQWEIAKGIESEHALVVTSAGEATLRATAERWRSAAPPADGTWAYYSSRQADPSSLENRLQLDGHELALEEVRFGVILDMERREVDVTVYHPAFPGMPAQARLRVAFLVLDWTLGEEGAELWIGSADAVIEPPARPQTHRGLRAAVAELAEKQTDDSWAILGGHDGRGVPLTATIQIPLKAVRWPRFDTHLAVSLPFRHRLSNGFPADESLASLRDFEDQLTRRLAGDGTLAAHETSNGRRTLHLYADGATRAAATVRAALVDWREGKATLREETDPAWQGVAHLRA